MFKKLFLACVITVSFSRQAHAYIDPVTGSVMVQAIVGGAAAIVVAVKSFRQRLVTFFWRKFSSGKAGEDK